MKKGEGKWMTKRDAAKRLNCSFYIIDRLIEGGQLGALKVPGATVKVLAHDVERLYRSSFMPAKKTGKAEAVGAV